jgi:hypothetical protein
MNGSAGYIASRWNTLQQVGHAYVIMMAGISQFSQHSSISRYISRVIAKRRAAFDSGEPSTLLRAFFHKTTPTQRCWVVTVGMEGLCECEVALQVSWGNKGPSTSGLTTDLCCGNRGTVAVSQTPVVLRHCFKVTVSLGAQYPGFRRLMDRRELDISKINVASIFRVEE